MIEMESLRRVRIGLGIMLWCVIALMLQVGKKALPIQCNVFLRFASRVYRFLKKGGAGP